MPEFTGECEIDIDPEDYIDKCSEREKAKLRELLSDGPCVDWYRYKEIVIDFYKGQFSLENLISEFGIENVKSVISKMETV